jgi:anthranilate phosphoribosyltransferase
VLNLLGPLTNPAAPRYRLIGAYDEASARLIADALAGMPIARAWVVHGANGWDEATPVGTFVVFDVTPGAVSRRILDPAELGLQPCLSEDLRGGDAAANCQAMRAVFAGHDAGPHRSALVLQCGLALHIAGRSVSVDAGIRTAGEALDSGRARAWLGRLEQFSAQGAGVAPASGAR